MSETNRRVWWGDYRTTEYATIDPEATIAVLPVAAVSYTHLTLPTNREV